MVLLIYITNKTDQNNCKYWKHKYWVHNKLLSAEDVFIYFKNKHISLTILQTFCQTELPAWK